MTLKCSGIAQYFSDRNNVSYFMLFDWFFQQKVFFTNTPLKKNVAVTHDVVAIRDNKFT